MHNTEGKQLNTSEVSCLEDALKLLQILRQKMRTQAQQLLVWRRAYKIQEAFIMQLQNENANRLKMLSSKLILFESRLIRKQKDISVMLNHRESIIHNQQKIITLLNNRLLDNGLDAIPNNQMESDIHMLDMDLVNDTDSAVVMEEVDSDISNFMRYDNCDGVSIVRSVSDAMNANIKCNVMRRSSGYLKRPEILETVYSVEEDADTEGNEEETDIAKKRNAFATCSRMNVNNCSSISQTKSTDFDNNYEEENVSRIASWPHLDNLAEKNNDCMKKAATNQVVTYNRVMSNHRSVTKPKDVKYKRINKAKSKSLEELRGRLKSWVEQGTKLGGIKLEHGQSYA